MAHALKYSNIYSSFSQLFPVVLAYSIIYGSIGLSTDLPNTDSSSRPEACSALRKLTPTPESWASSLSDWPPLPAFTINSGVYLEELPMRLYISPLYSIPNRTSVAARITQLFFSCRCCQQGGSKPNDVAVTAASLFSYQGDTEMYPEIHRCYATPLQSFRGVAGLSLCRVFSKGPLQTELWSRWRSPPAPDCRQPVFLILSCRAPP